MSDTLFAFAHGNREQGGDPGMTLRDYFAGQALVCIIQQEEMPVWAGDEHKAASRAYAFADAMLAEREKAS